MSRPRNVDAEEAGGEEGIGGAVAGTDGGDVPGGYAHGHPVVVCDGPVDASRFASVPASTVRP